MLLNLKEWGSKAKEFWNNHTFALSFLGVAMLFSAIALAALLAGPTKEVTPVVEPKVNPMVLPSVKEPEPEAKKVEKSSKKIVLQPKKSTKYKVEEKEVAIEEIDPLTLLPEYREAILQFESIANPKGSK